MQRRRTCSLCIPIRTRLGQRVKDAIFEATGLRCTVALATGKTVAKVAADAHKPDGLAVIEPGTEASFLAARPVRDLPGIGPKSAAMLNSLGVRCVGDLLDPSTRAVSSTAMGQPG